MKRYAVIDLGSNTFHLLIAEAQNISKLNIIFRKRVFTSLSEGGIKHIKQEKITGGLETLRLFKDILQQYGCHDLKVIGTAVLRNAENSKDFIIPANQILGTDIQVIDGSSEARYIYKGITLFPEVNSGTHLIMDIGGGSTEFILIKDGEMIASRSYILGVAVLHEMFHKSDPIFPDELKNLTDYVQTVVDDLMPALRQDKPAFLIGASGSFEILPLMHDLDPDLGVLTHVTIESFLKIYDQIIHAKFSDRSKIRGMPFERVKLIVVSTALKKTIIDLIKPKAILVSPYSLKEGVIREMIEGK
jgi:exopolyphosphatase/guanosine-5'-triphosphate,3'-diphosphate pyrophosphatase